MKIWNSVRNVFARLHRDERGQVSLENVLIIAAIALPILIFLYTFAWPTVRGWFLDRMSEAGVSPNGDS